MLLLELFKRFLADVRAEGVHLKVAAVREVV